MKSPIARCVVNNLFDLVKYGSAALSVTRQTTKPNTSCEGGGGIVPRIYLILCVQRPTTTRSPQSATGSATGCFETVVRLPRGRPGRHTGTALPRPHTCLPYRATAHMSSMGCRQPTASAVGHAARAFRRCWWAQTGPHRSGCAHAEVLNSPSDHPAPVVNTFGVLPYSALLIARIATAHDRTRARGRT